ncbi:hypothetical protein CRENPOLYSF2_4230002 [Crenothrix polyspora]|uniref:Uncharacterized protein n=1 Tax=Crenothrix polyspora TaxID=360316 RepID=A0A1R4HFH5_9GAMM|nr:hypothetical protein CRENPOLYSF2_4230002 [Crenothrix polyspora]
MLLTSSKLTSSTPKLLSNSSVRSQAPSTAGFALSTERVNRYWWSKELAGAGFDPSALPVTIQCQVWPGGITTTLFDNVVHEPAFWTIILAVVFAPSTPSADALNEISARQTGNAINTGNIFAFMKMSSLSFAICYWKTFLT